MIAPAQFESLAAMDSSAWMRDIQQQFADDIWPKECRRCQEIEQENLSSIRIHALAIDQCETQRDYLQVGGVLDNICNAACQTCNPDCSTRIGSLSGKTFPIINNSTQFWNLPQQRILHLDINGGEPSYSKNYKRLLANLPPNLKTLRLNTNCNVVLDELIKVADLGIEVTVTVSCDGIGPVHEFVRWPIKCDNFYNNLMTYKTMPVKLNLWTTVSILNHDDLPNIQAFARKHEIDHGYAYLKDPYELSIDNTDLNARQQYITKQKQLRGIE